MPSPRRTLAVGVVPGLIWLLVLCSGCDGRPRPRSERSFAEITAAVRGRSAAEVEELLGAPDSRQRVYLRDERWIWWNYTFLAGEDTPPEMRGRVVHLEIVFRNPSREGLPRPYSEWTVAEPFGIGYHAPGEMLPRGALEPGS